MTYVKECDPNIICKVKFHWTVIKKKYAWWWIVKNVETSCQENWYVVCKIVF
jgi:hypothetical protein